MDFIDKQDIPGLQIGQQRGQISGSLPAPAGCLAQIGAHFGRNYMGQGGLAQAGRAEKIST